MGYSKEKAKRAEFVIRELADLIKAINCDIDTMEFIDRGDYEVVCAYDEQGNYVEVDVTGTSLAELAIAVIERIQE